MKRNRAVVVIGLLYAAFLFLPLCFYLIGYVDLRLLRADPYLGGDIARTLGFTFFQAAVSAMVSLLIALPGAYFISHIDFPLRRLVQSASLVPFVLPSIIVIICMISFYGNSGVLARVFRLKTNLIYNFFGILIAHVFYNYAIALRVIGEGWSRISPRYREVAASLGDSRRGIFFRVTLPLLWPSILSAGILIFIYCFLSFGIVLVFGGIRFATLEVRSYQEMFVKLNYERAAVFGITQILFSGIFFVLVTKFVSREQTRRRHIGIRFLMRFSSLSGTAKAVVAVYWLFIGVFLAGPIISMVVRSFNNGGVFTVSGYRSLFVAGASTRDVRGLLRSDTPTVILSSLAIAFASGSVAFIAAFWLSVSLKGRRAGVVRSVAFLPMGISMVSLSIGLRLLYGDVIPPVLLIITGQLFLIFPFVFRLTDGVVGRLNESIVETARSLGATGMVLIRTVYVPILKRGLINAYVFGVAIAFADFTVVLNVGRGEIATFPIAIYRLIGFRSFDLALAMASIYILFCLILFMVIDNSSRNRDEPARTAA